MIKIQSFSLKMDKERVDELRGSIVRARELQQRGCPGTCSVCYTPLELITPKCSICRGPMHKICAVFLPKNIFCSVCVWTCEDLNGPNLRTLFEEAERNQEIETTST